MIVEKKYQNYSIFGQGSPLLFIHGTPGGPKKSYYLIKDYIQEGFELIIPKRWGYEKSEMKGKSFGEQSNEIYGIIQELKLSKVDILSISGGATIALNLLNDNPELFKSAVFISPILTKKLMIMLKIQSYLLNDKILSAFQYLKNNHPSFYSKIALKILNIQYDSNLLTDNQLSYLDHVFDLIPTKERKAGIINDLNQFTKIENEVKTILTPTLLVYNTKDSYSNEYDRRIFEKVFKNHEMLEYYDSPHLPHISKNYKQILSEIIQFYKN